MANTIFDFAAKLNASARPNQFRVHIIFPAPLVANSNSVKEQASFLTHTATLPSYETEDCQVFYRGRIIHEAGEKTYQQVRFGIYNSSDFAIRTAIEQWISAIHDPEIVAGITDPSQYKSNVLVEQLDRNNNTLRVYKMVGAWPASSGEISLSYQQGNEIESYDVAFYYDYFVTGGSELLDNVEYTGSAN